MAKQVEVSSQETELNVVEWHDATGWTEEILNWLLAWIEVVEEKQGHTGTHRPGMTRKLLS